MNVTTAAPAKSLLTCGAVAGPLYIVVVVLQLLIRDGFDITRHPASLLSNGDLGWIQVANFAVTGLLFLAAAAGLHRVPEQGTWGPRLVGVFGAGILAAAFFPADPVDGFPPGTPEGDPTTVSWQGATHFLVAGIGFIALIAACFVFARRFRAAGQRDWGLYSTVTGAVFLVTWLGIFVLPGNGVANVAFAIGIAAALVWTSLLSAHQLSGDRQK